MKRVFIAVGIIFILIAICSISLVILMSIEDNGQKFIGSEDSKIPIKKDTLYDYEILFFQDLGYDFDNYYVLLLSDIPEEEFTKFFYYVKEKECKKNKCNIGFFDDREAYNLLKESPLDNEEYITEHFIGVLTIDPDNKMILYPLKNSRLFSLK